MAKKKKKICLKALRNDKIMKNYQAKIWEKTEIQGGEPGI